MRDGLLSAVLASESTGAQVSSARGRDVEADRVVGLLKR